MKTLFALALAIFFVSGAAAQDHSRPNPPRPQTPPPSTSIPRYVSDDGRYSVMFPSDPKLSSQNITSPNGDPMVQRMAMASGDGALFMVGYFDYGIGIVFSLDKARDGMLDSVRGTLLDEQSVSLGGAPGREIKLAGQTDDGTEFINRARFYDVKPRVYVLQCMVQKSQDGPAIAERCEQFFDSFRVRPIGPG